MLIKDLPNEEKPRERLLKYGASNLSNEDLIAIILRCGTRNISVKELSNQILTYIKNIDDLNSITLKELTNIKGLGKVKAITILAAIELGRRVSNININDNIVLNNTNTVHQYFSQILCNKKQEHILVILLDNKKKLISYKIMFIGTIDSSIAHPREIFNYAIKDLASGIIIMHNHPSGIIKPSKADCELTNALITTGKVIGIPLLDHIITNGNEFYSFFDEMVKHEV